jgi:secreted protein with Ig-like and vWFA domain
MVLPPTELARQLTAQNAAITQIYSQNTVGYMNVPASAGGSPLEADNLGLAKPAQKEWVVPGQFAESANPTAGKTAVSAPAGAHGILIRNYEGYYGHPSDSNDRNVLAMDDLGENRKFATTSAFKPKFEAPKIVEAERHAATVDLLKTAPVGVTSSLRGFYDDKVGGKPTISGATPPATDVNEDGADRSPSPALAENKVPLLGQIPAVGSLFNTPGTTPSQNQNSALTTRQINNNSITDQPLRKPAPDAPVPQPEILTTSNAFSTFALNVSDVSFKLAEASLQNNKLPDAASIRSEEFINAFDYRDPEAPAGQPMAFASELARYPFAQNRELLRFAVKTAAAGRQQGRALNLVLLLDVSGSMERADRVAIIHEALRVLATQLQPQDTVSVVTFARTAHLWADGVTGDKAAETLDRVGGITPEGGTNLEEAMRLAYETARRHYLTTGMNRVVLLTDGAANLGNLEPAALKEKVETQRRQGIALDCFGIGWEDYNDDLLEELSSHGDGRYAFLNSPEDAAKDFAAKLAGALQIAAADVKVQVEFNPARVISYRQIGYAKHQLTKEQFRDNTVAAGEIAAQEAGNALYTIETNPGGEGPVATVHVRYRVPGTTDYREHSWDVPYTGKAPALDHSSPAMRLAATASAFSEWLAASPYAQEVTPDELLKLLSGVPQAYGADDRPKQLETMIREAKSANYDPRGRF